MSYLDQFEDIKPILIEECRWTPKAFEKFGVTCNGFLLYVPLFGDAGVTYDFSNPDSEERKKRASAGRPNGKKARLFGNLEILNSPRILCEGEWDLFAAYEAGLESVLTSSNGAGTFSEQMANELASLEINIIYDNDKPGRDGATKVAAMLKKVKSRVKNIDLSEYVSEKGDVRDFFNNGKTKDDLLKIIESTGFLLSPLEQKVRLNLANLKQVIDITAKPIDWFLKPLIPKGSVTLLTGDPGSGKSTLASFIAACASKGGILYDPPFGPHFIEQKIVMFSVEDPPEQVLKPRLEKFEANQSNIYLYPEILTLDEVGQATIKEVVRLHKPSLVIIDPIVSFLGGKVDTNKANEVREKMNVFTKIAEESQSAILVVRHMTKGSQNGGKLLYAGHGSIDFTASVRSELMFIKHPTDENLRLFGQVKNNFDRLSPAMIVTMTEGGPVFQPSERGETLEQLLIKISSEAFTSKNKEVYEDTKSAILKTLESRPMFSNDFKDELKEAGHRARTITRILNTDLVDDVESLRISFKANTAGKGRWVVGKIIHIEALENREFKTEIELADFLGSHDFLNSTFQDCQEIDREA